MRYRLLAIAALVLAVVISRPGHELTGELGLTPDPSFAAALTGALYDARTLRDDEGTADVGYLTADTALVAVVRALDTGGVASVQLRVDGHRQRTIATHCPAAKCPVLVRATLRPRVIARGVGAHRVEVLARGSQTLRYSSAAAFAVNVGAPMSAPLEVEPRPATQQRRLPRSPAAALEATVRAAAHSGVLAPLLGRSRLVLRERGAGPGVVTVLADVRPARSNVVATLPQTGDDGLADMQARHLRDLVMDVDVRRRRIVGVQPGSASDLVSWKPSRPPPQDEDDAPSTNFSPRRVPSLLRLSDRGPAFFGQDGDPVVRRNGRDWPVSFLFTGHASVPKVKAGLRRLGLTRRGHERYLGYRTAGGALRFDADRGLKTPCDASATDVHARVYAPSRTDRFVDPELGDVVVATVHLDHVDGCGTGPAIFGLSERAEQRLAALIQQHLHWRVRRNAYPLGNAESLRRDTADNSHVWLSDGLATGVTVP